jgi:hypothetical protein
MGEEDNDMDEHPSKNGSMISFDTYAFNILEKVID